MAHGGSQARGQIRAAAAGLHHRHSNAGSEPCLQCTPQRWTEFEAVGMLDKLLFGLLVLLLNLYIKKSEFPLGN